MEATSGYEEALREDPYLGYASIDEAQNDCKASSQLEVFARLLNRENLFVSGIAGSGKSSIVTPFINYIRSEFPENTVAVVAPTGAAAANIGGSTLHRWAGIIHKGDEVLFTNKTAMSEVDVLIIDEISMLPAYLFEGLDKALQVTKRVWKPFGGVQVILMGDFMQLPPVPTEDHDSRFAMFSRSWKKLNPNYCFIEKARRATDERLHKVLSDITRGKVTDDTRALVESRVNIPREKDKAYVNLFTTNRKIDSYNAKKLAEIQSPAKEFKASHTVYNRDGKKAVEAELRKLDLGKPLELKVGCPVILTKNTYFGEELYPNGSVGTVEAMEGNLVMVHFNDGTTRPVTYVTSTVTKNRKVNEKVRGKTKSVNVEEEIGEVSYLPLRLGYATSVHKSQGQTCDGVVADLNNIFTPGLGYVALSRVRNLDDLIISNLSEKVYDVDPASMKITKFVKHAALKSRLDFEANREDYNTLLTNSLARISVWGK